MSIERSKVLFQCEQAALNYLIRVWTSVRDARVALSSLIVVVLLGALIFTAPNMLSAQTITRPNFVVIMTDDQRLDDMRAMPKTRAFIGSGTTFANSFVTFPLCCPSRATYLTGQYPHNHGVLGNDPATGGGYVALNYNNTLPLWLQAAGYFTSHIGKYLNGYRATKGIPPGWTHWQGLDGGGQMYNYRIVDNRTIVTYGSAPSDYQTDVLARRAVATIDEGIASRRPFFLSIAIHAPHRDPRSPTVFPNPLPAPRHLGAFDTEPLPRPPSFNEADVSDKPLSIRNIPPMTAAEISNTTRRYQSRLASLLAVDDLVERVINKLASVGVLENTVVIYTSDNGFFQGEHRIDEGKTRVYEEASRVPLMIRGGGFPAGVTANQYVGNIDLAPTLVALAGATARRAMDGRSLLPLALNPSLATARNLLIETPGYKAIRNNGFVYVQHSTGERELYDMRAGTANYDPYQLNSRHASTAYAQIRSQLATRLNQLRTCSGTTCAVQ